MKFSTRVRYGVRGLTQLGGSYGKKSVLLKEISKTQDISLKYLDHIFSMLKTKGLIKKPKAKKGGYLLARSPREITLFEIIEALEGIENMECLKHVENCSRTSRCGVRLIWKRLEEKIDNVLKNITLADIVKEQEKMNGDSENYTFHI